MAASKSFQNGWTYNLEGDSFNDKVGRLLHKGDLTATGMELDPVYTGLKDMSATARAKRKSDADEQRRRTEASQAAPNITQTFAIVDGKGAVLQPPVQPVLPEATAAKILTTIKGTESVFFGMTEKQRSMEIWKKINPGCMESTLNLPTSTMHDHYIYEPEKLDTSLFDTTFHFKKTDFTEFCNKQAQERSRQRAMNGGAR